MQNNNKHKLAQVVVKTGETAMNNSLNLILDKVKQTVERNTAEGASVYAFNDSKVVYIKDKARVKKREIKQEQLPGTTNVAVCVNAIMETKSKGGIYNDGIVESLDDDGPIISVPYFGDADAIINGQRVKLGTVFTPYFLKVYFASLILWSDQNRSATGSFILRNGIIDILDLMRVKKEIYYRSGKEFSKYRDRDINKLKQTLLKMMRITIREFRSKEFGHGDALLDFDPKRLDKKEIEFMHARLVAMQLSTNFFQIPKTAIELPKEDIPYAIGINYMIRSKIIQHCLDKQTIQFDIKEWLQACGQDISLAYKKHQIADYYALRAKDIVRVAKEIDVGDVKIIDTDHGIQLAIVPTDNTVDWYQPLIKLAEAKRPR